MNFMPNSLAKLYNKEVYTHLNYHGTWFPIDKWQLGDIGTIQDGVFEHKGENLTDYDVNFDIQEDEVKADDSMSFSSTGTNETKIEASAGVEGVGKAQVEFKFNNQFGVIFKTKEFKSSRIKRQADVGEKIKELYKKNPEKWKNRAVIMELVQVESGSIIISREQGSTITLSGNVERVGQLDIADGKLGISIVKKTGSIMEFLAKDKLTPLFKMGKVSKAWLSGEIVIKKRADNPTDPKNAIEVLDFIPDASIEDLE
jgi:hypothetical protein